VRAAVDVLARCSGLRILVFGDMGELGAAAPGLHAEVGTYAKQCGIDALYALGEHARLAAEAYGAGAHHYERVEDLVADLQAHVQPDATVLVKGSRFMRMERVVEACSATSAASSTSAGSTAARPADTAGPRSVACS
jgi:UDP-N-acetylmuramyl pentapeptide synthase